VLNEDGSITFPQLPSQSESLFRLCSESGKVKHTDRGESFKSLTEIASTGSLVSPTFGGAGISSSQTNSHFL
jgi:hypothetical protein